MDVFVLVQKSEEKISRAASKRHYIHCACIARTVAKHVEGRQMHYVTNAWVCPLSSCCLPYLRELKTSDDIFN